MIQCVPILMKFYSLSDKTYKVLHQIFVTMWKWKQNEIVEKYRKNTWNKIGIYATQKCTEMQVPFLSNLTKHPEK